MTTRMAKASLMVREMLNVPDILGVQEARAAVLSELATRIDDDAVAAGYAAPGYSAYGDRFLVRTARMSSASAEVVGAGPRSRIPATAVRTRCSIARQ